MVGLEHPSPGAMQLVVKRRRHFDFVGGPVESGIKLGRVTELRAAHGSDNPADGGGPTIVAPPKEGKCEETSLVQKADSKLARGRCSEEGNTNGEMWAGVIGIPGELVPCQSNRGAPAEQVFAVEFTTQTERAMTERSAARKDIAEGP